jgi:hypothetical protein
MLRPGGYLITTDPDPTKSKGQKAVVECDTFTCGHCNSIVKVPPLCAANEMPGGQCYGCQRLICPKCVAIDGCDVIENKLEREEARANFRRQLG